jgi:hypothetical protein
MSNSKQTSFVLDRDGNKHFLDGLLLKVPSQIFTGPIHVSVCQKISQSLNYTGDYHKLYTNLLVSHSEKSKQITALIILAQKKKINIATIKCDYIDGTVLKDHINIENITFSVEKIQSQRFLQNNSLKSTFFKWIAHRAYRLFFKRKSKHLSVIRSWVEITEKMYGQHFHKSLILIYPFNLNFSRHIAYARKCFQKYDSVSLCGIPYRFSDWLRIIFSDRDLDRGYVQFEYNGYRRHGKELIKKGLKYFYTSEEFEAGSFLMAEFIRNHGGHITNTAHGLSFRAPYTSYDFFSVYNVAQRRYYETFSRATQFQVLPRINAGPLDLVSFGCSKGYALIFLEGLFAKYDMKFEADLQSRAVDVLREISESLSLRVFVKAHPNRKPSEYQSYSALTGVDIIKHLYEAQNYKPIFITIASAAYYDFRQYGAFIFIDSGYDNLEEFYGEKVETCPIERLEHYITDLIKKNPL